MFIVATILPKYHVSNELTRKLVHIGMSNWWFIVLFFFTQFHFALIPAVSFILLNYLSYRYHLVKGIEREDKSDLGTIYYPISLVILVIFSFGLLSKPYIGAIGVFIMGYGDGIAGILGSRFGKKRLCKNKTYIGSMFMFIISFLTTFILLWYYHPVHMILYSFIIASVATILELFSYKGIDNLTVPIMSSFIYYLLLFP